MSNVSVHEKTKKALSAVFRSFGTDYSLYCFNCWQEGTKPNYPQMKSKEQFAADYLCYNLARKLEVDVWGTAPTAEDLLQETVSGFLATEARLLSTRETEGRNVELPFSSLDATPDAMISTARRKIQKVLGSFNTSQWINKVGFSSGASTRLSRKHGAPYYKFGGLPHTTRNALLPSAACVQTSARWHDYVSSRLVGMDKSDPSNWFTFVKGSHYFTVPKTFDKLRGAAKEPDMNLYAQKGIGRMIRTSLLKVGIDLKDQSRNQYLACEGSISGSLATIDLSEASDSIDLFHCVGRLLDLDWFNAILQTRSPFVKLPDGSWHEMVKVSSMGNGFTFELESLIFYGLAYAAVYHSGSEDRRIGVYGDDIIVSTDAVPYLLNVLAFLGFRTNDEKSFWSGPFRESCGEHYWEGANVTPFNVKEGISNRAEGYHFINRLRLWYTRVGYPEDTRLLKYLIKLLLDDTYTCVPDFLGTKAGMFVPSIAEAVGVHYCFRRQGYVTRAIVTKSVQRKRNDDRALWVWLDKAITSSPPTIPTERSHIRPDGVFTPQYGRDGREKCIYRVKPSVHSMWPDCEIGSLPPYPSL